MKNRLLFLVICGILFPNCEQDNFPIPIDNWDQKGTNGTSMKPSQYCTVITDSITRDSIYYGNCVHWYGRIIYNNSDEVIISSGFVPIVAKVYTDSSKKVIIESAQHAISVVDFKRGESYLADFRSNFIDTTKFPHYYPDSLYIIE